MKYIKTYEALAKKFKKFLIIASKENEYKYHIIRNDGPSKPFENYMTVKIIYKFTDENNFIKTNIKFFIKYNELNILFQSDTLKDCVEMIPIMNNVQKYNIL